jgi:hypothetical protein
MEANAKSQITEWVDMVAQEIAEELKRDDTLDVSDLTHESVDGSEWVIYYGKAAQVVHEYAEGDEIEEAYANAQSWEPDGYWKLMTAMAYDILYGRVADRLGEGF